MAEEVRIVLNGGTAPASRNIAWNVCDNTCAAADRSRCRTFHDLRFQMSKVVKGQVCGVVAINANNPDTVYVKIMQINNTQIGIGESAGVEAVKLSCTQCMASRAIRIDVDGS